MAVNAPFFFLTIKTSSTEDDLQLESIAHGVISLEQLSPEYGAERRRLRITKLRGQRYRGGYHDFSIVKGGLSIFPRIVASEHLAKVHGNLISSGIPEVDTLLGGRDPCRIKRSSDRTCRNRQIDALHSICRRSRKTWRAQRCLRF